MYSYDNSGGQMAYRLPVSLPEEIEQKMREESKRTKRSLVEIIREALRKYYKIK